MIDATVVPQGFSLAEPGLSGIQSLRPAPTPFDPEALRRAKSAALVQTVIPSCLVLGISLPMLAAGWFMLDRFSVIRDNPLGLTLPLALAALGVVFLIATGLLWVQSRRFAAAATPN